MAQRIAFRSSVICLIVLASSTAQAADPQIPADASRAPLNVSSRRPAEQAAIERALDQIVSPFPGELTLAGLVTFLQERHVAAVLDLKSIDEVGIDTDIVIPHLPSTQVSLRSALNMLLGDLDLTYFIRDDRLSITTTERASNTLESKIYRVDDLGGESDSHMGSLIEVLTSTIYPITWDEVGGPGSILMYQGTLVISQTRHVHERIERTLDALRRARSEQQNHKGYEPQRAERPQQAALRARFAQKAQQRGNLDFLETPLSDVAAAIARACDMPIMLDAKALEEVGIDEKVPVTSQLGSIGPREGLNLLLEQLDLTFILKDEVLLITTTEKASNELSPVVYPVEDLIQHNFSGLIDVITSSIRPTSWDEVGGPGSIVECRAAGSLVVSQTQDVHDEIARMLQGLREMRVAASPLTSRVSRAASPRDEEVVSKIYAVEGDLDAGTVAQTIRELDRRSWTHGGRSLRVSGKQIIVRAPRSVHREIEELLRGSQPLKGGGMF